MTRSIRPTLLSLAAAALAVASLAAAPAVAQQGDDTRPNVVFVLLDDQDAFSPMLEAMPATRALIHDRGLVMDAAYAPTPICCPARGTMLTGKYGHNTGVLTNGGPLGGWDTFHANGNEQDSYFAHLQAAGYRTGMAGKYLNGIEDEPLHIPEGYTEWYGGVDNAIYTGYDYTLNENGTLVDYGDAPEDYLTDVIADKSVDFLERAARDGSPFVWQANVTAPHLPLEPAPRHEGAYDGARAPRRPNYQEPDVSDKPFWLRQTAEERSRTVTAWNDVDYRNRMGSLLAVDDLVADIAATLERTGELDNTYLIITSDNGYNLGSHRLIHKMAPYTESVRVPLAVAGPGIAPGRSDRMVLHTDLAPTLLDLVGVAVPADVDGRSLTPLLRGEDPEGWRTDFIAQYASQAAGGEGVAAELVGDAAVVLGQDIPRYRAVRTEHELYVEWYDFEDPGQRHEYELYDLREDPYELDNLLATPEGRRANQERWQRLQERLEELAVCSGPSCSS